MDFATILGSVRAPAGWVVGAATVVVALLKARRGPRDRPPDDEDAPPRPGPSLRFWTFLSAVVDVRMLTAERTRDQLRIRRLERTIVAQNETIHELGGGSGSSSAAPTKTPTSSNDV